MKAPASVARRVLAGLVAFAATALVSGQVFYVGNTGDGTISKVDLAGNVTTYATGFTNPYGLAVDASGTLYVSSTTLHKVFSVSLAGTVTDYATGFAGTSNLLGMAFDTSGNLYVADVSAGVYKVLPGGSASLWATGMSYPRDVAFTDAGVLYAVGGYNPMSMYSIASDGTATLFASQAASAGFTSLDFDSAGKAYVGAANSTYYYITPEGVVNTYLSGVDVTDVVYAGNGTFYYLAGNTLYRDVAGSISTFATGFNNPTSLAMATAVPEPATTAVLLGFAVLGVASVWRSRRRAGGD